MRTSSLSLALGAAFVLFVAACGSTTGSGGTTTGTGGSTSTTTASTTTTGSGGGLGAGQCRSAMDCTGPDFCSIVVLPALCGGQCSDSFDSDCQTDADCSDAGTGMICGKPCSCQQGGAQPADHCTPGCATDADCGPSLACDATHRCVGKACSAPADCTANFACDAATSQCAPRACTADSDCGDRCVNGACAPFFGTCSPAVP